jgi:lysophospholipase L1-like esterase
VSITRSSGAYSRSRVFDKMKIFYGFNQREVNVKVFVNDGFHSDADLAPNQGLRVKTWDFDETPDKIMLIMTGIDSPELYGVSLESHNGVVLDNISMRGSSGTLFGGLDYIPFKPMLDSLNCKLLILQFGGNTLPYIKDEMAAENYGRQIKNQIGYLRKLIPDAGVIFIGPGDMSTKVDGKMQTYPMLVPVRDALRRAAFETGSAFFDMYEAMGGKNSMIQWVEADEPLAAPDYVHFSPQGAKLIAEAFIKSFMGDYEAYLKTKVQ